MIYRILVLLFTLNLAAQQHCGYDFTSYVVLQVREEGKADLLKGLSVTLLDSESRPAINTDNRYSWTGKDRVLNFFENYRIGDRWFFPHAAESYVLSVTNEFPADEMRVRIEDPSGIYENIEFPLYAYNMYVLCTTQVREAVQFGRRTNRPVEVWLKKK